MVKWTMPWLVQVSSVFDSVAGSEDWVKCVSCAGCGLGNQLGETDAAHGFEEVGGVIIFGVIEVEVKVTEEAVVLGVNG